MSARRTSHPCVRCAAQDYCCAPCYRAFHRIGHGDAYKRGQSQKNFGWPEILAAALLLSLVMFALLKN